ncbi:hypothetical protein V2G26_012004 [Clonostachys chloroleuca]
MRHVTAAAIRKRGRRRVADENRKRAVRACERCKSKKVRCIGPRAGPCQKCCDASLSCSFESQSPTAHSPAQQHSSDASPPTPISTLLNQPSGDDVTSGSVETVHSSTARKGPLERIRWPRVLSHLRDVFSLDHHDIPDEYPTATHSETDTSFIHPHVIYWLTFIIQTYRPAKLSAADLSRMRKAANLLPLRYVTDFLLKTCIEFGTDSFFYFDQDQLLAEVDQFYTDPASALRYDASFICLVLSALALEAQRSLPLGLDNTIPASRFEDGDPGQLFFFF